MKAEGPKTTQTTFVVTAIFISQMTVTAGSASQALDLAEELGRKGATMERLSNWHAHEV